MSKAKKILDDFAKSPTATTLETMETLVAYTRGLELLADKNAPTLRDQFAMAALTGYMAGPDERTYRPDREDCQGLSLAEWQQKVRKNVAVNIYQMADAMLEARKQLAE